MTRVMFAVALFVLTACAGAPLPSFEANDSGIDRDPPLAVTVADDAAVADGGVIDRGQKLNVDADAVDAVDSAIAVIDAADASSDADATDAPPDASCTPVAPATWTCRSGNGAMQPPFTAPDDFCVFHQATFTYDTTTTPPECLCQETYNCACVLVYVAMICGGATPVSCSTPGRGPHGDPGNYLEVTCP